MVDGRLCVQVSVGLLEAGEEGVRVGPVRARACLVDGSFRFLAAAVRVLC